MEYVQQTVRMAPELQARLKSHTKAHKIASNTFVVQAIEDALNKYQTSQDSAMALLADPLKSLTRIHHKITDPWDVQEEEPLLNEEIHFLLEGARKELEQNELVWPFYEATRAEIALEQYYSDPVFQRKIFGFALRHYLQDAQSRFNFAAKFAASDIPTADYKISTNDWLFTFKIAGSNGPRINSDDNRLPPSMRLLIETPRIDKYFDWEILVPFIRLMQAVNEGKTSRCSMGKLVRISRDNTSKAPWLLHLENLMLMLTDNELKEIASQTSQLVSNDLSNIFTQLRMIYGEE